MSVKEKTRKCLNLIGTHKPVDLSPLASYFISIDRKTRYNMTQEDKFQSQTKRSDLA